MNRSALRLIEQSDAQWLVSLGNGSGTTGREASKDRSQRSASVSADPLRAKPASHEDLYALPSVAENASCKVIFGGVLYNRAALGEQFASSSSPPVTSDAELVLRAYLRWGENVLRKIKGVFALFVWDQRRDFLLCARDPLGVYPLFYADSGHELLFSTSTEALVRHPGVSDAVNRIAIADYLCYRHEELEETFYQAVGRVGPGHAMRVKGTSRRQYRYWDPNPADYDPNDTDYWVREDELEHFDELFDRAVDRGLQLGPPAIFLSGGLDSVSVAAVAADISRRKGLPDPLALSLAFPGPEINEEDVQRRVGSGLGLPHEFMAYGEATGHQGLLAPSMAMSSELSVPLYNVWTPAYRRLGLEGERRGCRVVLTGGGGDEWLNVSPYHAADLFRSLDFVGLYRLWDIGQRSFPVSRLAFTRSLLWEFGARPVLGRSASRTLRGTAPGLHRRRFRRRLRQVFSRSTPGWIMPDPALRRESYRRMEQRNSQLSASSEPRSFYLRECRRVLDHPLMSIEMEEGFDNGRRAGLPQFMPFFDADLVDFLSRTPPDMLYRGGRTKAMVRQTVARRFPGLNFERQKKVSAMDFFTSLLLKEAPPLWQAIEGAQGLAELGIVDGPALDTAMSVLLSGTRPPQESHRVRDILLVEAWLRPRLDLPLPPVVEAEKALT
jgi:asparagine synthase (glutamine-hydrolysing)